MWATEEEQVAVGVGAHLGRTVCSYPFVSPAAPSSPLIIIFSLAVQHLSERCRFEFKNKQKISFDMSVSGWHSMKEDHPCSDEPRGKSRLDVITLCTKYKKTLLNSKCTRYKRTRTTFIYWHNNESRTKYITYYSVLLILYSKY